MRTGITKPGFINCQIGLAVWLLVGVLLIFYGYFHPSRMILYAGLLITASGAAVGAIGLVMRDDGSKPKS